MEKEFNTEGSCFPEEHYMVDISKKLESTLSLIKKGKYFTINCPRQYGKTTTLSSLESFLEKHADYLPIFLSFEDLGSETYQSEKIFIGGFLHQLNEYFEAYEMSEALKAIEENPEPEFLYLLGNLISQILKKIPEKVVLMIDEVDHSAGHDIFLRFLGLLRKKYLMRGQKTNVTFHSVILAGVHDIKNLKLKIRSEEEKKYNSPWNIAADFTLAMHFSPEEITTMLEEYQKDKKIPIPITEMAEKIYYYTSGYPFLVSKLCKIIDEKLLPGKEGWSLDLLEVAVQKILKEENYKMVFLKC